MRSCLLFLFFLILTESRKSAAQSWSALGNGVGSTYGYVTAVTMYNGELYAGGWFDVASGVPVNNIARWNGSGWSALGAGLNALSTSSVLSLAVYNGELYAGGYFTTAGGIAARHIAKWNGTNWSAVGTVDCGPINCMAVFNGELYAAGYFAFDSVTYSSLGKWNGTRWSPVGTGPDSVINYIYSLAVYNGALYASGDSVGGGGMPEYHDIARWDGNRWTSLHARMNSFVNALTAYNGELYAAGNFTEAGGIAASQVARWNGTNWSAAGTGINTHDDGVFSSWVSTLAVYNGALYAGGNFLQAGPVGTKYIAKWDGSAWTHLHSGADYWVSSLVAGDTALYVGGWFRSVNGFSVPALKVAQWTSPCHPLSPSSTLIIGQDTVCENSTYTYSIPLVAGATDYSWTLPGSWSGQSITNSITATSGTSGGTVSVTVSNSCSPAISFTLPVFISTGSLPVQPGPIQGSDSVCSGNMITYTVLPVPDATGYTWTLPSGWTGSSMTNTILVTAGPESGMISVSANNHCGSGPIQTIHVRSDTLLMQPGPITGEILACKGNATTYFINPLPGADHYSWTLPDGWTGTSDSAFITVIPGGSGGNISVRAFSLCGSSPESSLALLIDSIPRLPGPITGHLFVNTGETHVYSIPAQGLTGTQHWAVTGNNFITGIQGNTVTVIWKNAGSYTLSVRSQNKCGASTARELGIEVSDPAEDDPYEIRVMPNPASEAFYVRGKKLQAKKLRIEVLNMAGQLLYRSGEWQGANDYSQRVTLDAVARGIYLVRVGVDGKWYLRKLAIMK